jgi:hypothetical protein
MQLVARFIEFATAPPRAIAARAIAEPTIARINAYSAAAAPESSFNILRNFVMSVPYALKGSPSPGTPGASQVARTAFARTPKIRFQKYGVSAPRQQRNNRFAAHWLRSG